MRKAALAAAITCFSIIAAGKPSANSPAQLKIMTQTVASLVGARVQLFVQLTNVSDHSIEVGENYTDDVDRNYEFHLINDTGVELQVKLAGQKKSTATRIIRLNPGQLNAEEICLSCVYGGFNVPGKYTFSLSHQVSSDGQTSTIQSNELTFSVVPKEEPGAPFPLEIKLFLPQPAVAYGAPVDYNIELINRSNHDLDCSQSWTGSAVDETYRVQIVDSNGKHVLPTQHQMEGGSSRGCTLPVGQSKGWESAVQPGDYPALRPGKYTLRISTANPDNPRSTKIDSNPVALTILPVLLKDNRQ